MNIGGLGEFGLLELIKPYVAQASGQDDAAVLPGGSGFVVASCDVFVEGVHFDLGWMNAENAGWRSLALALGDLAAKGATPSWALVSLAVPARWKVDDLVGPYRGMSALARDCEMEIVGGDMSAIDGPAVVSITVTGRTDKEPLSRARAMPGWTIAVSGPLGGAAVALRERREIRLHPRLDEGRRLNGLGLCCGDVSDGLLREMEKFAFMARAGSIIRAADVPVAAGATLNDALTGGEEAELVCAGPEEVLRGAGLKPVGTLTTARTIHVVDASGAPVHVGSGGYDHFA